MAAPAHRPADLGGRACRAPSGATLQSRGARSRLSGAPVVLEGRKAFEMAEFGRDLTWFLQENLLGCRCSCRVWNRARPGTAKQKLRGRPVACTDRLLARGARPYRDLRAHVRRLQRRLDTARSRGRRAA